MADDASPPLTPPAPAPDPAAEDPVVKPPMPPPPPGTRHEGFWERSVTHGAIVTTILNVFPALRAIFVEGKDWVPILIDLGEITTMTWAVAFGISKIGVPGLRRTQ